jgi:defect-in-organelle-trafficking protein DotB
MAFDDRPRLEWLNGLWQNQPPQRMMRSNLDELARKCSERQGEISDIVLSSGNPPAVLRYDDVHPLLDRYLNEAEMFALADELTRDSSGLIRSGSDYDFRYRVPKSNQKGYFFYRANLSGSVMGPVITLRIIPEFPPTYNEYGFEPELEGALKSIDGMLMMTGATGSGKTTALAAVMHHTITTKPINIIAYESPPEFDFYSVPNRVAIISQTDLPGNLPNYPAAVRNSLRRAPKLAYISESRDVATIMGCINEVRTGHGVMSTAHTPSVAGTMDRLVSMFPPEDRRSAMIALIDSLRIIINQKLLKSTDGKRVAMREWVIFTPELKTRMFDLTIEQIAPFLHKHMLADKDTSRSRLDQVDRLYAEGRITDLVRASVRSEFKAEAGIES